MRALDVPLLEAQLFDLVPAEEAQLRVKVGRGDDLELVAPLTGEDRLELRVDGGSQAVRATPVARHDKLVRLVSAPEACVVGCAGLGDGGDKVTASVRAFANDPLALDAPLEIGLDERLLEDLAARHGVRGLDAAGEMLADRLLLTRSRAVASIRAKGDKLKRLRLHGSQIAVDVALEPDGAWLARRVIRRGRAEPHELVLLDARVQFADARATSRDGNRIAGDLMRATLFSGEWLSTWRRYDRIRQAHVIRTAREVGAMGYDRVEPAARGWRFHLRAQASEQLALLEDSDTSVLAASTELPPVLTGSVTTTEPDDDGPLVSARHREAFVGRVSEYDEGTVVLTAVPGREEESPPPSGILHLSLVGDRTTALRRRDAQARLASRPRLAGLLLEQALSRRRPRATIGHLPAPAREPFGDAPTPAQEEAVRIALETPDVAIIVGPPGTGKTRVIKAIEAALANDARRPLSRSILVTSYQHEAVDNAFEGTRILGLPGLRIGGRAGSSTGTASFEDWLDELREGVDAVVAGTTAPRLIAARSIRQRVLLHRVRPRPAAETAALLEELAADGAGLLPPVLRDRLDDGARRLRRGARRPGQHEQVAEATRWVRALRTTPAAFDDDGPMVAARALDRLDELDVIDASDRETLEVAAGSDRPDPPVLAELAEVRDRLLGRLQVQVGRPGRPVGDDHTEALLRETEAALDSSVRASLDGPAAVLADYRDAIEHDPEAMQRTVREYAALLAATCSQSVGREMRETLDLDGHGSVEFETVLIDEAARSDPLDILVPAVCASERIVLVGDHRQLPHMLEQTAVDELVADQGEGVTRTLRQSLFERLYQHCLRLEERGEGPRRCVVLDEQFRMHPVLGHFVGDAFYEEDERFGSPRPAEAFDHGVERYEGKAGVWIDVPAAAEAGGRSKRRPAEARRIAAELHRLIHDDPPLTIGVVCFYRAQVDEIWRALRARNLSGDGRTLLPEHRTVRVAGDAASHTMERLRVGTVDAFQGREFDVVLLSVGRSNAAREPRSRFGHLMLPNRMCVAMSRQKRLLAVVGDLSFATSPEARRLIPWLGRFHDEVCRSPDGAVVR